MARPRTKTDEEIELALRTRRNRWFQKRRDARRALPDPSKVCSRCFQPTECSPCEVCRPKIQRKNAQRER